MQGTKYNYLLLFVIVLLLAGCDGDEVENDDGFMDGDETGPGMMGDEDFSETGPEMMEDEGFSEAGPGQMGGTAWGDGAFESNGERIYFTGTSERSGDIPYTDGPDIGGMMMGGKLSCASCHGPNARGGEHRMQMQIMDAPNIRWDALAEHGGEGHEEGEEIPAEEEDEHAEEAGYTLETFRMAVVEGVHPTGEPLSEEMPRWQMSEADLSDLAAYLRSLEGR